VVQSACSTSLVAVHTAAQSLLNEECDIALAGGVSVLGTKKWGYLYRHDALWSEDGHIRPFDARARGTLFGEGVGVVVLKRLADAVEEGDQVIAVIKGSAVNNDGMLKVAFTAPSIFGQAEVITEALAISGVDASSIGYLEAHGTGTALGDPIEIAALTQAFGPEVKRGSIPLGTVKSNLGHPNTAAGVAGLIKTALSLKHRVIAPSLNFETPNPQIDFAASPFYVNTRLSPWPASTTPRRAGVSSFGMGGTNAHVVLEESPDLGPGGRPRSLNILPLSAKTPTALQAATVRLATHLSGRGREQDLEDIAYTLSVGRREFNHRRFVVCRGHDEAIEALQTLDPQRVVTDFQDNRDRPVVFMFPGGGAQYPDMGRELYEQEPRFQEEVNRLADFFRPHLGQDIRSLLYPAEPGSPGIAETLNRPLYALPALFTVEYALAKLWMSWGLKPNAMIGHSLGEYTAACLSGVLSPEDATALVALRGRLFEKLSDGAMLAVPLSESELGPFLEAADLSIAAVNAPGLLVVSGALDAIDRAEKRFLEKGVDVRRLHISVAAHSSLVEPILEEFTSHLRRLRLNAPSIPYISNVTGTWITELEATDPNYWAQHLRRTVRFGDGVGELLREADRLFLEVGPGRTLCTLAKEQLGTRGAWAAISSMPHPDDPDSALKPLLMALGKLWLAGARVDWFSFYAGEHRRRVPLPAYPFERQRYRIESPPSAPANNRPVSMPGKKTDLADWFYLPTWKQTPPLISPAPDLSTAILVLADPCGLGDNLIKQFNDAGRPWIAVRMGKEREAADDRNYTICFDQPEHYEWLIRSLRARGNFPGVIIHCWNVTKETGGEPPPDRIEQSQALSLGSLLFLAQALGNENLSDSVQLVVVSSDMQSVTGGENINPVKALLLGPCQVIPLEYPTLSCRSIDVLSSELTKDRIPRVARSVLAEIDGRAADRLVALRGARRWTQGYEALRLPALAARPTLREGGVWLIAGGLGGVGLELATYLAKSSRAKLVLTGRSAFPPRKQWESWLEAHDHTDKVSRVIRRLMDLEQLGASVLTLSADVADRSKMQEVITRARRRFGRLDGVINAAGAAPTGIMQLKTWDAVLSLLRPKVTGTLTLFDLLKKARLDHFILCSSMASVVGEIGMVDHSAANAFLDAFSHRRAAVGDIPAVSINWGAWLDVGQASEVVLSRDLQTALKRFQAQEISHPLIERTIGDAGPEKIFVAELSADRHWVLNEHRIQGVGLLPGAAYLEVVRAAFEPYTPDGAMVLRDVVFVAPFTARDGERNELWTVLTKAGEEYEFKVYSRGRNENGSASWASHVFGRVGPPDHRATKTENTRSSLSFSGNGMKPGISPHPGFEALQLGPRWKRLGREFRMEQGIAWVTIELPDEFARDLDGYKLHPAMMDAATCAPEMLGEGLYLPFAYDRLAFHKPFTKTVSSRIKYHRNDLLDNETIVCDVEIVDKDGERLIEVEGFTLKRLESLADIAQIDDAGRRGAGEPAFATLEAARNEVLANRGAGETHGIRPDEGVEAFARILSPGLATPQVIVTTGDLHIALEQASKLTIAKIVEEIAAIRSEGTRYARPDIRTPYVEPRDDFERGLARIWEDLIGVEPIGINDNFFDLGGHSLLATKVTARLREDFQIELPVRALFESPTIAELAGSIVQIQAEDVDDATLAQLLNEIRSLPPDQVERAISAETRFVERDH
jgi:phthiocerol/phenolphthiocerol synthesis type-I polyketide synthase E